MVDIPRKEWPVHLHANFDKEFDALPTGVQDALMAALRLVSDYGPRLGRPHVDTLAGSKHANMKELRVSYRRQPWRFLFAFDPDWTAIVLTGGNKAAKSDFYRRPLRSPMRGSRSIWRRLGKRRNQSDDQPDRTP